MIVPQTDIAGLIDRCNNDSFTAITDVLTELEKIASTIKQKSWEWCIRLLTQLLEKQSSQIDKEDLVFVINTWMKNKIKLNNMTLKDAEKEFDKNSRYGYGIDGDEMVKENDFFAVRGTYTDNSFVQSLIKENEQTQARGEKLLGLMM
jgi:hypothetical protein